MNSKALKTNKSHRFWKNTRGATAMEYALFVALIAVSLIVGLGAVYNAMDRSFSSVADETDKIQEK